MFKYLIFYFIAVNIIGAALVVSDKNRAKKNKWRIRESTLWLFGLIGGAPLVYAAMKLVRHKTKHISFMAGMPLLAVIEIALLIFIKYKGGI